MRISLVVERRSRRHAQTDVEVLVCSMWLYVGRYAETQLTTEQRELLYDLLDASPAGPEDPPLHRWWRD